MGKKKAIALPTGAKETAQNLLSAARQSQSQFRVYIEGCKDTLGLEGDWNLNTQTWEFEPVKPEKKEEN